MTHMQRAFRVGLFAVMTVTIALPAAAGDIVAFSAGPSGVTWRPLIPFEHGVLTVSTPDGLVFREEFKGGGGIAFDPSAHPNFRATDGTYKWQVLLGRPSAVNPRLGAAARANREGDGDPDVEARHRAASTRATQVQSGAFTILNRALVPSDLVERGAGPRGAAPRSMAPNPFRQADWPQDDPSVQPVDQVIPDDLIVQGSLCVGFDCVNNESFGFDTIRLKENNTRIKFEDTSVGTFPSTDWQLTANDSANGGQSKFSIEDITGARVPFTVEAGATTNSLYVDSTGRVGFRTSTPVLDLHVNTSNTPGLRLEQNSSGGFTAQTWDIAGNEANFFVRDVTGGSRLPFRIRPGAPTSSIDIAADGKVGIGTASPSDGLDVSNGSIRISAGAARVAQISLLSDAGNPNRARIRFTNQAFAIRDDTNASDRLFINTNGAVTLAALTNCATGIRTDGAGLLSCIPSTRELKNVAGDLAPQVALANVMALRPQVGSFKDTPDVPEHWLIAEETAAVDPALVGLADGKPFTVKTQNVVADLIAVVQLQQRWIEQQQRRLEALEQVTAR